MTAGGMRLQGPWPSKQWCRLAHAGYKAKSEEVAHAVQYQTNPLPTGDVGGVELLDSYRLSGMKKHKRRNTVL